MTISNTGQTITNQKLTAVRVLDIILNIEHPKAIEFGGYDAIGTIFFSKLANLIFASSPACLCISISIPFCVPE